MIQIIYVTGLILVTVCFHNLCRSRIVATIWSFCAGTFFVAIASGVTSASHGAPLTFFDFAFGFGIGAIGSFLPNVLICAITEMAIIGLVGRVDSSETTTRPSQSRNTPTLSSNESLPRLTFVAIAFIHFTVCVAVIATVLGIMHSFQLGVTAPSIAVVLLSICGVVAFPVSLLMYYLETFFGNNLAVVGVLLLLNSLAVASVIGKLICWRRKGRDQK